MPFVRPRLPTLSVSGRGPTLRYSSDRRSWRNDLADAAHEARWTHIAVICAIALCLFALAAIHAAAE